MKQNPGKSEGIALIEIIISLAVIGVIALGVNLIMIHSMGNNKGGEVEQQAAMYGQQIFEDFKSPQITKSIDGNQLKLSDGSSNIFQLIGNAATTGASVVYRTSSSVDLGNRYKADITVKANESGIGTAINKQVDTVKSYEFNVALIKNGKDIDIIYLDDDDDEAVTSNYDESKTLTLLIYAKKTDTQKEVTIKDENGKTLLDKTRTIDASKGDLPIKLNINFEKYTIDTSSTADPNVAIKVFNQDDEAINIVSQGKSKNLYVSLSQCGEGEFTFYDESISQDLYDITVNITRDGKTIFSGSSSQNIKIAN